jgi:hypothetical protein
VYDASGRGDGASGRWATLLDSTRLNAKDGGAKATSATTHVIVSGSGDAQTASYLASLFGVPVESATPAVGAAAVSPSPSASPAASGVTVILGSDEEKTFNHDNGTYGPVSSGGGSVSTPRPTRLPTAAPQPTRTAEPTAAPTATPTPLLPPITPAPTAEPSPGHKPTPTPAA